MSVFGERLESRRVGTQKKFAQSLGIPLNTYTNWIRGIRKPDMDAIIKLCTQMSVSADWLLGLPDRSGGAVVTGSSGVAIATGGGSATVSTPQPSCSTCPYKALAEALKKVQSL